MSHYPFQLEPLPYACDALVPCLGPETVAIHHDRHQAAYVKNLNKALENCPQLHRHPLEAFLLNPGMIPASIRTAVCRNAGGVYSHELYFDGMTGCRKSTGPVGRLAQAIDRCYGSFERFRDVFTQTALSQFGSRWAWLAACPDGGICVLSTSNQETPLSRGLRPVLCVDVWEHAYYLDHQNRREAYLDCWWGLVDWEFAEENFLPCCGGSASRPRSL